MRGAIGRSINNSNNFLIPNVTKQTAVSLQSCSSFCSGSGRGRGGPSGSSPFDRFAPTKSPGQPANESKPESSPQRSGLGHGRGKPSVPPSGAIPSFSSFISLVKSGSGRGRVSSESDPSHLTESPHRDPPTPQPRTFTPSASSAESTEPNLPSSIVSVLSGAGRGRPGVKQPPLPPGQAPQINEENRHIRARPPHGESAPLGAGRAQPKQRRKTGPAPPKLSREEAVENARRVLSQASEGEEISRDGLGRGRGRGRGKGSGRGRGRGRGRGEDRMRRMEMEDMDEGFGAGLYLGDNADGEKMAEKVGVENMNSLVEAFEEMSGRVLPSPMEESYVDAMHTNYMIECEPEYLMEEFGTNPDIDEKPPIPLRDALEKMKPFLMAYEGIQSQEEWEEAVSEVMERVPLLKEIVDHYSGPDRVTAKQQQEELERVAKTIPKKAPASLKRFANRAVLSLQSNPGWGFDKKCQFMDKLVWEASQQYK